LRSTQSEFVQEAVYAYNIPTRGQVIRMAVDFAMWYTSAEQDPTQEHARSLFTVIRGCTTTASES
jgi:hypothetical protein